MKTAGFKFVSSFSIAGTVAALGLVAAMSIALAQGTPEQQQACSGDAQRLCGQFIPDASKVGVEPVFKIAATKVSNTIDPSQLPFAMSTMLFQSLGFYMLPFNVQSLFTAKSAVGGIRPCASRAVHRKPAAVIGGTHSMISFTASSSPNGFDKGMTSRLRPRLPITAQ